MLFINVNQIQRIRLYFETKRFDIQMFFKTRSIKNAAVCLITKDLRYISHTIFGNKQHFDTAELMYRVYLDKHLEENTYWQEEIVGDGNILIQLCSDCSSLIWIPETLTKKQIQHLEDLNNQIKNIVRTNLEYFTQNPILLDVIYQGKVIRFENEFDKLLENLEKQKPIGGKK